MTDGASWLRSAVDARRTGHGVLAGGFGYFLGESAARALTFLVLIGVARLLSLEAFAWLNLYIVLANIAALVVGLGVQTAIVRFYFRDVSFAGVLGTSAAVVVAAGAGGIVLAVLLRDPLGDLLHLPPYVVVAAAVGGPLLALRASLLASLRARSRVWQSAAVQGLEAGMGATLILALAASGALTYQSGILALLGATAIIAVAAVGLWSRDPGLEVRPGLARGLMTFSLPLVFHGLAIYVLGAYGQVVVNLMVGPEEAGKYAYAYRFAMAMLIVSTAFSAAWGPAFLDAMRSDEGRASLRRQARSYWATLVTFGVLLILFLPVAARILGGPAYEDAARVIPLLTYGYVWHIGYTLVLGFHLDAGRTQLLAIGSVVALAIGITATIPLIAWLGIVGAALGSVLAYVALFVLQLALTRRSEGSRALELSFGWIAASASALGALPVLMWLSGYPWF